MQTIAQVIAARPQPDVFFTHAGNITMCSPNSDAAKAWVAENVSVESWAWLGTGFAVDHRCVENLKDGFDAAGLTYSY